MRDKVRRVTGKRAKNVVSTKGRPARKPAVSSQKRVPSPVAAKPKQAPVETKKKRPAKPAPKQAPLTALPSDWSADQEHNRLVAFPIVGIGASAGGLEALELFLKSVPPNSGMAFIIVQHLDPTHKGMLVELLQRITPMPVS